MAIAPIYWFKIDFLLDICHSQANCFEEHPAVILGLVSERSPHTYA